MKRTNIVLALLVLLVGTGLWLLLHKKAEVLISFPSVESKNQKSQKTGGSSRAQASTAAQNAILSSDGNASGVSKDVMEYLKKIKADPEYDGKQPINFYGRVVDESNVAVANANVHFEWTDLSPAGNSEADTKSDENGFFSLRDRLGKRLIVDVVKEGYYSSGDARNASFEYANPADGLFIPDQNNPRVFHLRKKGEGVELIHGSQLFGFRTNGPVQYLDLIQGKNTLTPPGDLAAQIIRDSRNNEARFNWSVTISVPSGGIFETNEEFMFEAPPDGYQQSIEVQMMTNDLHWVAGAKKRFYFKSRNGSVYGWAEATIYPQYQNAAAIDLDYYVNPSGSRNLESK